MVESPHGQAGLIIPVIDNITNVETLYEGMKKYILNSELLQKHSKFAYKTFKNFRLEKCVKEHLHFFKSFFQ